MKNDSARKMELQMEENKKVNKVNKQQKHTHTHTFSYNKHIERKSQSNRVREWNKTENAHFVTK